MGEKMKPPGEGDVPGRGAGGGRRGRQDHSLTGSQDGRRRLSFPLRASLRRMLPGDGRTSGDGPSLRRMGPASGGDPVAPAEQTGPAEPADSTTVASRTGLAATGDTTDGAGAATNAIDYAKDGTDKPGVTELGERGGEFVRKIEGFLYDVTQDREEGHDAESPASPDESVIHEMSPAEIRRRSYGRIASNLYKLRDRFTIEKRGLDPKAEKRLLQTPGVRQNVIQGLLDAAYDPAIPTQVAENGWRKAALNMRATWNDDAGKPVSEVVTMNIFTFPEEVTKKTPTEFYSGEPQIDQTYFERSNVFAHGTGNQSVMEPGWAEGTPYHAQGVRNPGTFNYDVDVLRSVGVRYHLNAHVQPQYIVRAEVGIRMQGTRKSTRYIVYETCQTPSGESKLLIARADTRFYAAEEYSIDGIHVNGTSHIPSAEEVGLLTQTLQMFAETEKTK